MSVSLKLYCWNLFIYLFIWNPPSNLPDGWATAVWEISLVLCRTDKIHPDTHPFRTFYRGSIKCEIRPNFSTPVAFEGAWFQNGAAYPQTCHRSVDDLPKYWLENFAHSSPNFLRRVRKVSLLSKKGNMSESQNDLLEDIWWSCMSPPNLRTTKRGNWYIGTCRTA